MRKIGQVYYKKDYSSHIKRAQLISGSAFDKRMIQLTIQAPPGVKFYLNESIEPFVVRSDEKNPGYGKYEIDLSEGVVIYQLSFDKTSAPLIDQYLIVDYIYEEN